MACNGCTPLIDKQPPGPGVAAFEIELLSCDLDQSSTYRNFIYEIRAVNNPAHDISNIKLCLPCLAAFVEANINIDGEIVIGEFVFESSPGDPAICSGVKFDSLPDNKEAESFILTLKVIDSLITVNPEVQIGYKAATNKYIWTLCGPACNGFHPNHEHRERGIKFI